MIAGGTRIIHVDAEHPDDRLLAPAAEALRRGELVAFPTETVYGLGANALDERAVAAIFAAKGRPADNPLIVHIASPDDLPALVREVPPLARRLLDAFAPGPLTLVLPKSAAVPDLVTAGLPTVAVRIPAHPVARRLIELAGVPVAAPSANRSGRPSPTRGWHVAADLAGRIACLVEAGSSQYGLESTVVDLSRGAPVILRPGAVTAAMIEKVAGQAVATAGNNPDRPAASAEDAGQPPRSPGMKYRHYAPAAGVLLIEEDDPPLRHQKFAAAVRANLDAGRRIGVFICREGLAALPGPVAELDLTAGGDDGEPHEQGAFPAGGLAAVIYADRPDAAAAANRLFDALRSLDRLGADLIVAEGLPASEGLGAAYMNRLRKAAAAGQRKTVLFVCTGNTCRSPMAAALFNRLNTLADWSAESAGLAALPGEPASLMVQTVLLDGHGIDLSAHRARLAEADLVAGASHVLTMTENQRNSLRRIFPEHAAKIQSLGEMAGEPGTAVADPFGGSLEDYEETAAQLRRLIGKLLEKLAASSGEPEGQDGT